jgi:hypothetical protein
VFLNDSITGNDPSIGVAFEEALRTIKGLGATIVDPADLPSADDFVTSNNETIVLDVDFKVHFHVLLFPEDLYLFFLQVQLNQYLKALVKNPSGVRSLADLIKFDDDNPTLEEPVGFKDQSECVLFGITTNDISVVVLPIGLSGPKRPMASTQNILLPLRQTMISEVRAALISFSKSSTLMQLSYRPLGLRPVQRVCISF